MNTNANPDLTASLAASLEFVLGKQSDAESLRISYERQARKAIERATSLLAVGEYGAASDMLEDASKAVLTAQQAEHDRANHAIAEQVLREHIAPIQPVPQPEPELEPARIITLPVPTTQEDPQDGRHTSAEGIKLASGTAVRFFSSCGPCIPSTVIKANRTTHTLESFGKIDNYLIHTAPCSSCTDHPRTQYRDGYMD